MEKIFTPFFCVMEVLQLHLDAELLEAVRVGDGERVLACIAQGVCCWCAACEQACETGRIPLAQLFMTLGACDMDRFYAAAHAGGQREVIEWLETAFPRRPKSFVSALRSAAKAGHSQLVVRLLDRVKRKDYFDTYQNEMQACVFAAACEGGQLEVANSAMRDAQPEQWNWNKLVESAAGSGDVELVKLCLFHGATELNAAFGEACSTGDRGRAVRDLLLPHVTNFDAAFMGASRVADRSLAEFAIARGATDWFAATYVSCAAKSFDFTSWLFKNWLDANADVEVTDMLENLISRAAFVGFDKWVMHLLDSFPDVALAKGAAREALKGEHYELFANLLATQSFTPDEEWRCDCAAYAAGHENRRLMEYLRETVPRDEFVRKAVFTAAGTGNRDITSALLVRGSAFWPEAARGAFAGGQWALLGYLLELQAFPLAQHARWHWSVLKLYDFHVQVAVVKTVLLGGSDATTLACSASKSSPHLPSYLVRKCRASAARVFGDAVRRMRLDVCCDLIHQGAKLPRRGRAQCKHVLLKHLGDVREMMWPDVVEVLEFLSTPRGLVAEPAVRVALWQRGLPRACLADSSGDLHKWIESFRDGLNAALATLLPPGCVQLCARLLDCD